jgi:lipopolysaccharide transport protein LptA
MIKMVKILCVLLFITTLNAKENYLNIDANNFEANEQKNIMSFKGDVKMTKNKDILKCDLLIINTITSKENPKQQIPKEYKAKGNVSFTLNTKDNVLHVKGDTVFYYPKEQKYIIIGNGYLEDTKDSKKIVAHKIYIDEKTGHTKIDGKKNKPVTFRLKLDSKEQ